MSTATATPRPSFDGRLQAVSSGWAAPAFVETRRLCKQALSEMGERCSTRRAHRLAEMLFSIWRGDEVPALHSDPTAEQAIKNVMKGLGG